MDRYDVPRQTLDAFGIPVQVTPLDGSPGYTITALLGPIVQESGFGHGGGHIATHRFRTLPEDVVNLAEGDILTPESGEDYAVHQIVPAFGRLTRVQVIKR